MVISVGLDQCTYSIGQAGYSTGTSDVRGFDFASALDLCGAAAAADNSVDRRGGVAVPNSSLWLSCEQNSIFAC